jgi:hypothetical protein
LTVAPDAIMEIVSKDVREQGKVSLAWSFNLIDPFRLSV